MAKITTRAAGLGACAVLLGGLATAAPAVAGATAGAAGWDRRRGRGSPPVRPGRVRPGGGATGCRSRARPTWTRRRRRGATTRGRAGSPSTTAVRRLAGGSRAARLAARLQLSRLTAPGRARPA